MSPGTPKEWAEEYRRERPKFEDLTIKLRDLIDSLLASEKIDIVQLDYRTKTVESFGEKLVRKKEKYINPLSDVTDLVGLRIITYYVEDLTRVGRLLKKEFSIDANRSIDKRIGLDPSQFGYMSVHYIMSVSPERAAFPEWKTFAGILFEVQVRTALQHAWAAVDHKLNYKSTEEAPAELRRRLFRLSALFELADDQFSELRRAASEVATEYSNAVQMGDLHLSIDAVSLEAYLEKSSVVQESVAQAVSSRWEVDSSSYREKERRGVLLRILLEGKIETLADFERLIGGDAGQLREDYHLLHDSHVKHHVLPTATPADLLTRLVLFRRGIRSGDLASRYTEEVWNSIEDARKEKGRQ